MRSLSDKVVIVTGGSKGMGRHFVDALSEQGAKVACFARPSTEQSAVRALNNPDILAVDCDVSSSSQADAAMAQTLAHFGHLDALVNNAGFFSPFLIENAEDRAVEQHVSVNLLGPIWLTRAAIPHLRSSQGQIVSVSSESVRMPFPYLSVYAATKAALETFGAAMRDELREYGIRVTTLRSGSVSGSTGNQNWDPKVAQEFMETIMRTGHAQFSGAPSTPESMAEALVSVLSLPVDINIDLIEVRSAAAGTPGPS